MKDDSGHPPSVPTAFAVAAGSLITIITALVSKATIPTGSKVGFIITGLAAIGLSSFMYFWDLAPF